MTSVPPRPENPWTSDTPQMFDLEASVKARPAFSKAAIAGFTISCIGLFVFAMLGPLGAAISGIGLRRIKEQGLRGRGLAIAGIIIGAADLAFYLAARFLIPS